MKRNRGLVLVVVLASAACGGAPAIAPLPSTAAPLPPSPPVSPPASSPPSTSTASPSSGVENPQGAAKAPDKNASVSSPAAPKGRTPCSQEVALQCSDGLVDGCLTNVTNSHMCVEKTAGSVPCKSEVALKCGPGKIDACLVEPNAAKVHVCAKQ